MASEISRLAQVNHANGRGKWFLTTFFGKGRSEAAEGLGASVSDDEPGIRRIVGIVLADISSRLIRVTVVAGP